MADFIQLDVVTPERRVVSERVDSAVIPGRDGEIGILPSHSPMISELGTGVLTYIQAGMNHSLLVSGGFVELNHDRVSVLANLAELPEEIDATVARHEQESAEKALGTFSGTGEEFDRLRLKADQSAARLKLSSEHR